MLLVPRLAGVCLAVATLIIGGTSCSLLVDTTGLIGSESGMSENAHPAPDGRDRDGTDAGAAGPLPPGVFDASGPVGEYRNLVLADGPSLYYTFEETSGPVQDAMGRHHGTVVGNPQRGVDGALPDSRGIRFGGTIDGIDVGDKFAFPDRAPFTIETWFRPDAYDSEYRFIFARDHSSGSTRQALNFWVRSNRWDFERYIDGSGRGAAINPPPPAGEWYHFALTYDGSTIQVYLDGELRASSSDTRSFKAPPTTFYVGRGSWSDSALRGILDEFAIYERALPAERIKAHYDAGVGAR